MYQELKIGRMLLKDRRIQALSSKEWILGIHSYIQEIRIAIRDFFTTRQKT